MNSITYELQIRFIEAEPDRAAALKRQVLKLLMARGITEFAEGVIDGVDIAVANDADGDEGSRVFDGDGADRTPVLVFNYERAPLDGLAGELDARFPVGLAMGIAALETESWSQAWDEGEDAIVTERFHVHAGVGETPPGRWPLRIAAGEAFGSGRHATTKAALEMLEALPATPTGAMLDVGTGTGILAIAAARLGYGPLFGTDIDEAALAEARLNAAANGVQMTLTCTAELPDEGRRYALIAANILVPVLHHLLPRMAALLAPAGQLVLAGFIDKEAAPLIAAAARLGLRVAGRKSCRGWVGLALARL